MKENDVEPCPHLVGILPVDLVLQRLRSVFAKELCFYPDGVLDGWDIEEWKAANVRRAQERKILRFPRTPREREREGEKKHTHLQPSEDVHRGAAILSAAAVVVCPLRSMLP